MFTLMAQRISSFFIHKGIIKKEDEEIYDYSFEIFFATVFEFFFIVLAAFALGRELETVFYVIGFIPMRRIAGGYHATTHFRCFCILAAAYFLFVMVITYIKEPDIVYILPFFILINIVLIFTLAPAEDKNRPVSSGEKLAFKKKSRVLVMVYSLAAILLLIFIPKRLTLSLTLGVLTVASSLLAAKMRNRLTVCRS